MPRLVWLASYPKSGNTWTRAFLTAYLAGPGAPLDLNDIDASLHAASRPLFDRVVGLPSGDLTAEEIDRLRAGVYRAYDIEGTEPLFLKTHDRWRLATDGQPVFPPDATRLVVLIVRNPLAVAPSFANHMGSTVDDAITRMSDDDAVLASQTDRLAPQLPQPMGSWSTHTTSWLDQDQLPVLVVRYEDLRAEPAPWFSRILAASGIDPDPDLIADALDRTSFDRLRAAEAEGGFRERPVGSSAFFRRGSANGWREELTDEQVARIVTDHGAVMARLHYSPGMEETTPWQPPALQTLHISLDTAVLKVGSTGDGTGTGTTIAPPPQ